MQEELRIPTWRVTYTRSLNTCSPMWSPRLPGFRRTRYVSASRLCFVCESAQIAGRLETLLVCFQTLLYAYMSVVTGCARHHCPEPRRTDTQEHSGCEFTSHAGGCRGRERRGLSMQVSCLQLLQVCRKSVNPVTVQVHMMHLNQVATAECNTSLHMIDLLGRLLPVFLKEESLHVQTTRLMLQSL